MQYTQSDRQVNFILKYILVIYFSIYQMYNNCYSLARVWTACDRMMADTDEKLTNVLRNH